MRVIVTGATGNVGTSVVDALRAAPEVSDVVGVARRPPVSLVDGVRYVAADVASDDLSEAFAGADVVVHLAWLFQPTHSPLVTWRGNVEGSIRVFDAAIAAGAKAIVHASSVGAYSPAPTGTVVDESWPTNAVPTAAYGREKSYVERVLDAVEARHPEVRVVRLRPGFIFKRPAANAQRRLFLGPFVPNILLKPNVLPVVPLPADLRFQALHSHDVGDAYRRAVLRDVRGAFNVAADPVIGPDEIGDVLGARVVRVPRALLRGAMAAAWHAHVIPAEPALLDLVLSLPVMDTTRARTELGWTPTRTGTDALREALEGMADGAGGPTAALEEDSLSGRVEEIASGVGERA